MDRWLRTDERLEAVQALETVCDLLSRTAEKPHYWKWVVIALDNAFQGYMVLALRGSNSFNVFTKKSQRQRSEAWKRKTRLLPAPRLDDFMSLYEKIQEGRDVFEEEQKTGRLLGGSEKGPMMMYVHSQPFKPKGTQDESVRSLHELRNEFIHYVPKGLSLYVADLPHVVTDCVDIIAFLTFESGNINDEDLKAKTREVIEQVKHRLDGLKVALDC